jgi:hypothetical protein
MPEAYKVLSKKYCHTLVNMLAMSMSRNYKQIKINFFTERHYRMITISCSIETLLSTYKSTRRYHPEDQIDIFTAVRTSNLYSRRPGLDSLSTGRLFLLAFSWISSVTSYTFSILTYPLKPKHI